MAESLALWEELLQAAQPVIRHRTQNSDVSSSRWILEGRLCHTAASCRAHIARALPLREGLCVAPSAVPQAGKHLPFPFATKSILKQLHNK